MIFSNNGIQSMYQTRTAQQSTLSDTSITPLYEPKMLSYYYPNQNMNLNLDLKNAPDFFPTPKDAEVQGYQSLDPRLIDPRRNIHQILDRPAQQPAGVQPLCLLSQEQSKDQPYVGIYPNYQSITGGNRQYYISPLLSDAFYEPMYQIPSEVKGVVYQDPMGALKPYYDRRPLLQHNPQLSGYTYDQDEMAFREDIMSKQASRYNRTNFEVFQKFFHNDHQK